MTKKPSVILKLEFGSNGIHSFRSLEEIDVWLQAERSSWSWISNYSRNQPVRQLWENYNNAWNNAASSITSARQRLNQPDFINYVVQIQGHLQQYQNGHLIHASSRAGRWGLELSKTKPTVAVHSLAYLAGVGIANPPTSESIGGAFEALKFREGISSNIDHEKQRLDELSNSFVSLCENYKNDLDQLVNTFHSTSENIEELKSEQQQQFDQLLKDGEAKLKEIEQIYDKKLALQSSVSYWEKKYKRHLTFSWVFGIISFISALTGIYIIKLQYAEILRQSLETTTQYQKTEYLRIAMIVIVVSFVLWFIRILVRILLSHIHLGTDANERVTMIKTYLALLREGNNLQENEKQLILTTLFRPSTDGIVKDDGVPPSVAEFISRVNSGSRPG